MRRLTRYLARLFVTDAMVLFGVVCFLLWLLNCLRGFDIVAVKGQSLGTLGLQGLLSMPTLAVSFFYICVGIGLSRALQALQSSHELHIIHTSHGLGSMWRATIVVAAAGVVGVLLMSNFVEPYAKRQLRVLTSNIAADLVSSTLRPQRFTQVTDGVVLLIGGRSGDGEIQEFFADDRRDPQTRQTYIAQTARVASDGDSYVIVLRDGALQYRRKDGRFSEIQFAQYELGVERLSQPPQSGGAERELDTVTLIGNALASGEWTRRTVNTISDRLAEGVRVVGISLLVLSLLGFPSGRRSRFQVPMEALVVLIAFTERGVSAYSPFGAVTGALMLCLFGGGLLLWRARKRHVAQAVPA